MEKEIVKDIICALDNNLKEKGEYVQFNDPSYKPIKINKDYFHEIKGSGCKGKTAFIDGGNAEILKASNFSLQFIRIYCSIYENNRKIKSRKKEFYILINAASKEESITYRTQFFGLDKESISFDSFDETIRQGKHRITISSIGNAIRRFAELEMAKDVIDELDNKDIIVLDGDLKASVTNEIVYLEELYRKSIEKGVITCAISKTSQLFTEKGNALMPVLDEDAPESEWYYYPLVEVNSENHKARIYIVKLHRNSRYTFKLEVFKGVGFNEEEIFSLLKGNSMDAVFLGYPYGLIEADKMARVSNRENEYMKTVFLAKLGKNNEKIAQYLNTLNAHNILDSIG
ncbi:DNA double-strand break repair nuclease NurA [Candidatus Woesearchaeota archaeon]|nr:DNA double-strand break repair nuclease NurA [Candidatus Woesearchaeota archaeon]